MIFTAVLSQNAVIEDMRNDIFRHCNHAIKLAINHIEEYKKYEPIWRINREEYLEKFLIYGRGTTKIYQMSEENPEFVVKESKPTLDIFKEEVHPPIKRSGN